MASQATSPAPEAPSTSLFSSIVSFLIPTAHAEAPAKDEEDEKDDGEGKKDDGEEKSDDEESGEGEESPGGGEEDEEEEEEEEEPEDLSPSIRQDCEETQCVEPAKHFKHCSERVEGGQGWHGEDCVEELFHMMHCVDACAAPKLFKRLA